MNEKKDQPKAETMPPQYMLHPETFQVTGPVSPSGDIWNFLNTLMRGYDKSQALLASCGFAIPRNPENHPDIGIQYPGGVRIDTFFDGTADNGPDRLFCTIYRIYCQDDWEDEDEAQLSPEEKEQRNILHEEKVYYSTYNAAMIGHCKYLKKATDILPTTDALLELGFH